MFPLPETLVKTLAKNVVKNLAKIKNLVKNSPDKLIDYYPENKLNAADNLPKYPQTPPKI